MRIRQPRIMPTVATDWTDDSRPVMEANSGSGPPLNVFATIARHPKLLKRWVVFANHVLNGSTLPARERELIILRTGYLCRSGYEWAQHVAIGRAVGLSDEEVQRLTLGSTADGWADGDRALLQAAEELVSSHFITDNTWAALATTWSEQQLMDLVFAVGQYTLVSMALNSFGVQLEDTTERFPANQFADGLFPRA